MNKPSDKPIFKYIGGKTWLKLELRRAIELAWTHSEGLDCYVEPFCGGLGAFLGVYETLLAKQITRVILNDTNGKLIDLYRLIQTDPGKLIKAYQKLEQEFQAIIPKTAGGLHPVKDKAKLKKLLEPANQQYLSIRAEFNQWATANSKGAGYKGAKGQTGKQEARLLFLQKHGFNGVYRENGQGEYNTPYGWSGKKLDTKEVATSIQGLKAVLDQFAVTFSQQSVSDLKFQPNQLLYLDPPYLNDKTGENKYNQHHFDKAQQLDLIARIAGQAFVYSNHAQGELITALEQQPKLLEIKHIARRNIITASGADRQQARMEILAVAGNQEKVEPR